MGLGAGSLGQMWNSWCGDTALTPSSVNALGPPTGPGPPPRRTGSWEPKVLMSHSYRAAAGWQGGWALGRASLPWWPWTPANHTCHLHGLHKGCSAETCSQWRGQVWTQLLCLHEWRATGSWGGGVGTPDLRALPCLLDKDGLNKGQKWYGPNRSRRY